MEHIHKEVHNSSVRSLVMVVLIMASIALGAYAYTTIREAKYLHGGPATISVNGKGEVVARPDIATFSFSVIAEADDAGSAQEKSATSVNSIIDYLKKQGIEDKDIKTLYYNLNPRYEYLESICNINGYCPPGERVLKGYEVNQTIEVKVRTVDNAGSLISGVGTLGATNVSSLQFTIDDEEVLIAQAREKAIKDAREQAEKLASDLGVHIVRIVGFGDSSGGRGGAYPMYTQAESFGASDTKAATPPAVPSGENTFTSNVNITYEIR